MKFRVVIPLGLLAAAGTIQAQEPQPVGDEFEVNTYRGSWQAEAAVAADDNGNFVVVWYGIGSDGTDTSGSSIQGRRYATDGAPLGGQFQINSYTTFSQDYPAVAADEGGDFVVVWTSYGSLGTDTWYHSIQGQRFASDGSQLGGQFQVNTYTPQEQWGPAVAADADGDFVVVWANGDYYGSIGIQGQLYDASGSPVGEEFQINTYTTGYHSGASVAVADEGDFVVVWQSYGSSGSFSIQAQRYAADGTPAGGQFQVNTYITSYQDNPSVAVADEGNFVVTWASFGSTGSDTDLGSIQGQRFDSQGTPVGGQFQVNSYTTGRQNRSSITSDSQGNLVVTWTSEGSFGSDTDGDSIQGQAFDASGNFLGEEFQVNTYTTSQQRIPAVAGGSEGNFVVVWQSHGTYPNHLYGSIQGQRFSTNIFTDGFESGDTSAWSNSVP